MEVISAIYWDVIKGFDIGPLTIRWYGILFALAFVVSYQIMFSIFKKEGRTQKELDFLAIVMVIATVVGARLGHTLLYDPQYYLSNPIEILMIRKGGLASHGAAVGILIGLWIFVKRTKNMSFMWILDRLATVIPLAGSFIRLGNFFNSEILGKPSDLPWAVIFGSVDQIPRHPVQLYESFSYIIISLILFFLYFKKDMAKKPGFLFGLFLILLFGARFVLEFFKMNQAEFAVGWMINMGQLLSIPFIIAGFFLLFRRIKK
jgi:phosphatidylglycerol:prolipoprotein diacylglycerol transferase